MRVLPRNIFHLSFIRRNEQRAKQTRCETHSRCVRKKGGRKEARERMRECTIAREFLRKIIEERVPKVDVRVRECVTECVKANGRASDNVRENSARQI